MPDDILGTSDLDMFLNDDDAPAENSEEVVEEQEEENKDGEGKDSDESGSEDEKDGSENEQKDDEKSEETPVLEFSDDEQEEDQELSEAAPFDLVAFKKKYPKALEEFPGLRPALLREQNFTYIFSTVEEARTASERAEAFRNFEAELVSGQSKNLLNQLLNNPDIRRDAPKAFDRFTDNYLEALREVSPNKYNEVVGRQVANVLKAIKRESKLHKNENLEKAVQWVTASIFDTDDPDTINHKPVEKNTEDDNDRKRFDEDRKRFDRERYDHAMSEVSVQVTNKMKNFISDGLDPNKRLNKINHDLLVERIAKDIDITLGKDERHAKAMRLLWERAGKAGFTAEWRNRIRDTYLANAQRILPELRMKRKDEAFKKLKAGDVKDTKVASGKAPEKLGNKSPTNGKGNVDVRKIDFSRTSDKDIFNDKVTLRK